MGGVPFPRWGVLSPLGGVPEPTDPPQPYGGRGGSHCNEAQGGTPTPGGSRPLFGVPVLCPSGGGHKGSRHELGGRGVGMREGVGGGARCLSRLWGARGGGPHFGDSLGGFKHISGHVAGMTFWGPGPHFGGGSQVLGTPTLTQAPLGLPPPPLLFPPPLFLPPSPSFLPSAASHSLSPFPHFGVRGPLPHFNPPHSQTPPPHLP